MRRHIGLVIAAAGLVAWRRLRPASRRQHLNGRLLGDERRSASVALVWALELEDPAAAIAADADRIAIFDIAVIVVDRWHDALPARSDWHYEFLPDAESRTRFRPDADWATWTLRRVAAIRQDWSPDFEIVLGAAPPTEARSA